MLIDLNAAVIAIVMSGTFCALVILLWCIVASDEEVRDPWFIKYPIGSAQDREEDEDHERAMIGHAMDKGMKEGKMLNPAYRMTLIGPDMTRHDPLKMSRHGSEPAPHFERGHHHAAGTDAFEGEGQ